VSARDFKINYEWKQVMSETEKLARIRLLVFLGGMLNIY
jgi:hypothetical protein